MKLLSLIYSSICLLFLGSFSLASDRVLMVLTSHSEMGDSGKKTGYWLAEFTHPYYAIADAGYEIDVVSIEGGMAPIDSRSLDHSDPTNSRFFEDAAVMRQVIDTQRLADMDASQYSAIVFAGGHGTMWDLPQSPAVNRISASIYENNGVVAAVCHGPAALANITLKDGSPLIKGKKFAAFTNEEEKLVALEDVVPFLLQTRLEELGGEHVYGKPWSNNVVVDERLITGQNPQSAHKLGEEVVKELKKLK